MPVVVIAEVPLHDVLQEAFGVLATGAGLALSLLTESQNLRVTCIGLCPPELVQRFYELLAADCLSTRIAMVGEARPRWRLIAIS